MMTTFHVLLLSFVLIVIIVLLYQMRKTTHNTTHNTTHQINEGFQSNTSSLDEKCSIWLEKKNKKDEELQQIDNKCPNLKLEISRITKLQKGLEEIKNQYSNEKEHFQNLEDKINNLIKNLNSTAKANHTANEKTNQLNTHLQKI